MKSAPLPENEASRLRALHRYGVLDTGPEQAYDDIVRIASHIAGTQISLVSLIDSERQWFKARHGLDATQTPRDVAFCAHAILQPSDIFIVEDTAEDERFFDNPLVTNDPSIRFYAGVPLTTPEGEALGTLCVIDRTPQTLSPDQIATLEALARQVMAQLELRRASDALTQQNRDLEQFTAMVSHDLQEPLRTVTGFTQILLRNCADKLVDDDQEALQFIGDASTRMSTMIRDLLSHARLGQDMDFAELDVGEVLQEVMDDLSRSIEEHGAQVTTGPMPKISASRTELRLLLQNLIGNAIKFSSQATTPSVEISATKLEGQWQFCVSDNGPGIAPEHQKGVFDVFRRLQHDVAGSGVGLAHCKKIVDLHGGSIRVESEPGQGARFLFTIPDIIV